MGFRILGVEVTFSFWFFVVISCFMLVGREVLLIYLLAPIAIHETGHLLAIKALGVHVKRISFTAFGIEMERKKREMLSYGRETLVSLGGVMANLLAAGLLYLFCFQSMRVMLMIASNLAVAVFNLAPIGDLDGGQVTKLIAERFFQPDTARAISKGCSLVVLALLFGFAIFMILAGLGNPTLLVACGYLAFQVIVKE